MWVARVLDLRQLRCWHGSRRSGLNALGILRKRGDPQKAGAQTAEGNVANVCSLSALFESRRSPPDGKDAPQADLK